MRETQFVHRLPVPTPTLLPATTSNVYFVEHEGNLLIIDAGFDDPAASQTLLAYLEALQPQRILGIVLTHHHRDHAPGAKWLAQKLNCPILSHPLEEKLVNESIHPYTVDATLIEGDIIEVGGLNLTILHTPGHTAGHLSLWLQEERILFAGDTIVAEGTTWIGPPDGNLIQYLQTLDRIKELDIQILAPGHGGLIRTPQEKIQFFIQRRLEREQQILNLLGVKPHSISQLVQSIYQGKLHPSVVQAAERTVAGHLEKLLMEGKVIFQEHAGYSLK